MYKRAACLVLLVALTLLSAACDGWNPFGIPDDLDVDLDVETTSELGASTLSRIDDLNDMLDRGVEIGPETRGLIAQLNETIRNWVTAGFDEATLQRVDELLRRIEDGFKCRRKVQGALTARRAMC